MLGKYLLLVRSIFVFKNKMAILDFGQKVGGVVRNMGQGKYDCYDFYSFHFLALGSNFI